MSERVDRSKFCATCGKPRGALEQRRESWSLKSGTPVVPRPDDPSLKPWQITNDLIVSACIYRNGGCSEDTHLCDDCLRIGLRFIKLEVDRLMEIVEGIANKDAEISTLTERLGCLQHAHHNLEYDYKLHRKRAAVRIAKLEAALKKISDGEYGENEYANEVADSALKENPNETEA